jgi:hypothetical protein
MPSLGRTVLQIEFMAEMYYLWDGTQVRSAFSVWLRKIVASRSAPRLGLAL